MALRGIQRARFEFEYSHVVFVNGKVAWGEARGAAIGLSSPTDCTESSFIRTGGWGTGAFLLIAPTLKLLF